MTVTRHSILRRLKQLSLITLFLLTSLLTSRPGLAHEINPAVIDARLLDDNRIQFTITLNLEAQITEIAANHIDTSQAPNVESYENLRAMSPDMLNQTARPWLSSFLNRLSLKVGEPNQAKTVKLLITNVTVAPVGNLELARDSTIELITNKPITENWTFYWAEALGPAAFRFSTASVQDAHTAYLFEGKNSGLVNMANLIRVSGWEVFADYIPVGFAHIVPMGIDHILFVIGLFLFSAKWRPLLWQVSAFTIAHTLTLAMSMLGIISIPASIVEPIIAASIVYIAVENIAFRQMKWWRPAIIFIFGLIHGLGFASVLTDFGLSSRSFLGGLFGFNVGVELGQLSVIAFCYLTVGLWFRHKPWYRSVIVVNGSIAISLIGTYWFIERVFF